MYAIYSAFQVVTMSSLIEQGTHVRPNVLWHADEWTGTEAISILSAIHAAVIVLLFSVLLANALVATQIVE